MPKSYSGDLRERVRTVPGLSRIIRSFVTKLGADECANYFRHAGYASI
jgi:hypothetical protein